MEQSTLCVSIDLESEIRKITQRQYLNDVHYLVQLVRHALLHSPRSIGIRSSRQWLEVHQDGQPFDPSEWELLTLLLDRRNVSDETKQRALAQLEEHHGIAVLSALLTFSFTSVTTGKTRLVVSDSGVEVLQVPDEIEGYTVRIRRHLQSRAEERRELEYFCSGSRIPIYYNNAPINKAMELDGQILTVSAENDEGDGIVGIPYRGDLCRFEYFKNGIRVGMKQYLSDDGRIFHGLWDSLGSSFEPHYGETVEHGDRFFQDQARQLYEVIGDHFEALNGEQRSRIKALLMGLETETWHGVWADLPLFASIHEPFVFSLDDLLNLKKRYGAVPCIVRPVRSVPRFIPYLTTEDIWFLKNKLNLPLRLHAAREKSFLPRFGFLRQAVLPNRPNIEDRPAEQGGLPEAVRTFLSALNEDSPWLQFDITSAASFLVDSPTGHTTVYLQIDSPNIKQARETFERNPDRLPLLRYILLDVARRAMGRGPLRFCR